MGLVNTSKLGRFLTNLKNNFAEIFMEKQPDMIYTAESSDGVTYTVTVPGVTSLYAGLQIKIKPGRNSSSVTPTLNVNNLGAKGVRQPLSINNVATVAGGLATWLSASSTVTLTYTGSLWKTDFVRTSASYMYGSVGIANGGTGATTADAALSNLGGASVTYVDEQINALLERIEALESQ